MRRKAIILATVSGTLLVLLIVAVAALLLFPPTPNERHRAMLEIESNRGYAQIEIIFLKFAAVHPFEHEHDRLPTPEEFNAIVQQIERKRDQPIRDPWGRPYHYQQPGPDGQPFLILSYGADGQPGGQGENAPITSTQLADQLDGDS